MVSSLWTAATGMQAQQMNIDNIANNLANANTHGFKKGRILFQDLLYHDIKPAGAITAAGINHPTGIQMGMGSNVVAIEKIHSQGTYQNTNNPFDMTIEGDGFFQVKMPDKSVAYTRVGTFRPDSNGDLVTPEGYRMIPHIRIPKNAQSFTISSDGIVTVRLPGDRKESKLGQIKIARFINSAGLEAVGENLYFPTGASGKPQIGIPSEKGFGKIRQNFLETSNVVMVDEMVNMITGQRAYEINAKAIQTSDEMLQTVSSLKR